MSLLKKLAADLTAKLKTDTPSPYRLADHQDDLNWDRRTDGTMADAATSDDTIHTIPYEADK
jgi:hypothetical protein